MSSSQQGPRNTTPDRRPSHRRSRPRGTSAVVAITAICSALLPLCLGCGAEESPPPSVEAEQRQAIKRNLIKLGAKVTAEQPEALYASLRNTHVQVLASGGVVESSPRTRQDYQDFGYVNEAVAREFLDEGEFTAFQQWLRQQLSPAGPGAGRAEYGRYELSVSRSPLRVVFSPRSPAVDKETVALR